MTGQVHDAGTIALYFYGELSGPDRAEVQAHLRHCAECRRTLDDLSTIREALASRPEVASPPLGDWSGFMARLDAAVQHERHRMPAGPGDAGRGAARARALGPYLAVAATLALVTLSVVTVVRQRPSPAAPQAVHVPQVQGGAAAPPPPGRFDPALASVSGQHFERSKLVVLGLATRDASAPATADWTYERDLAATLLGDTRVYRAAAEERGMDTLAGVMRDLELVLLQTSMSEATDAQSLEQLQRLIRRRDLLAKMNVVMVNRGTS